MMSPLRPCIQGAQNAQVASVAKYFSGTLTVSFGGRVPVGVKDL